MSERCVAVINIVGKHYQCDEPEHPHYDIHSNLEAQTVWACSTGPLSMDDNDERAHTVALDAAEEQS